MAADEYYDAIGETLSYILSAEDLVVRQVETEEGARFVINRDNTDLDMMAVPDSRYFMLVYPCSLTGYISRKYNDETQLLRGDMERYDIDDGAVRDDYLNEYVAYHRIKDVDDEDAEKVLEEIGQLSVHSDCRLNRKVRQHPVAEEDEQQWNGVDVVGLLYPYEDTFSPREYEQVAQEVISVGNQIEKAIGKLDVMQEIGLGQ